MSPLYDLYRGVSPHPNETKIYLIIRGFYFDRFPPPPRRLPRYHQDDITFLLGNPNENLCFMASQPTPRP